MSDNDADLKEKLGIKDNFEIIFINPNHMASLMLVVISDGDKAWGALCYGQEELSPIADIRWLEYDLEGAFTLIMDYCDLIS